MSKYSFTVYDEQGHKFKLNDSEYLNYLLEESHNSLRTLNHSKIRSLQWDFEELMEYPFYERYLYQIKSEINSLKRVWNYELIHNKPRRVINCFLADLKRNSNSLA